MVHLKQQTLLIAAVAWTIGVTSHAYGDTINLPASHDAMIFGGVNTTRSNGAGPTMFAGTDGNGSPKRSLISFDVSQIPANSLITDVTLTLYLAQVAGSGGGGGVSGDTGTRTIRLYNLTSAWGEGTTGAGVAQIGGSGQGYPAQTGDATWNYAFYNQTAWATAGGDFVGNHEAILGAQQSAAAAVGTSINAPYTWNATGMISNVQAWLDNNAANGGWILKNDDETDARTFRGFWTKDGAAANSLPNLAPQLSVSYIPLLQGAAWTNRGGGTWLTNSNWSASAPNGVGMIANLTSFALGPATIGLTTPITLGMLNFSNANGYTVTGSTITLQSVTGPAQINVITGMHTVASSLQLASALTVNIPAATSRLDLTGNVSGPAGLTFTGSGTATLSGNNSYRGGTTVQGGMLVFASPIARPAGDVLTLASDATVVIGGDASNLDAYRSQLHAGTISSPAGVGYLTGAQYDALHGATLDASALILKGTVPGDADLDGLITIDDYLLIDRGYAKLGSSGNAHWFDGDFNHDGTVDALDYALIDASFAAGGGAAASALVALDTQRFGISFLAAYQADVGSPLIVPEPASGMLVIFGVLALCHRPAKKSTRTL